MNRLSYLCLTALSAIGIATVPATAAEVTEQFVTVHCESPGSLVLSEEALLSPHLKVTGNIDRRDFETLKYATISVTRILDLSETVIHEYTSGADTRMDWIIGDPEKITYPADMLPSGAFSEIRDNSISKFTRGSSTLKKLILPASLKGFMKGVFTSYSIITDLEVPKGSTTLRQEGKLVYSYDGATLLAMPPAWFGDITVAHSVTSVADGVFDAAVPASVTFTSSTPPALPEGATLSTAYIIAPTPDAYSELFPDIDCIKELETVTLTDLQPGELMGALGNQGYTRKDVRSVKLSGTISTDDFNSLIALPNLHAADLSEATVQCVGYSTSFRISNPAVTEIKWPAFSSSYSLTIESTSMLHGDLTVPDFANVFSNYTKRFTSVVFPASLYNLGDRTFPEYGVTETLDFSRCHNMTELYLSYDTQCLTTLLLPDGIEKIRYIQGPLKEVNLPNSLKEIYGGYWMVEKLVLPKSLETASFGIFPMLREVDASAARSLTSFSPFDSAPNLKTLDISMCPLTSFYGFGSSYGTGGGVVATGGTRYPAKSAYGIESVSFPSTLTDIRAFTDCPNLKSVDLMHCFRLESFAGLNNCPSLTSVTLPENLKTFESVLGSPALTTIKCAAAVPPVYTIVRNPDNYEPLDFSKVSLTVAKDGAGAYRMAEGWENCKEISDNAYRVSIDPNPLYGGVDNAKRLLLYGAGLYAPGSEVTLDGYNSGIFAPTGWQVDGEIVNSNPCKVTVNGNIEARPVYSLDNSLCAVVFKVSVPTYRKLQLRLYSARRVIYVDGEKSAWWNYTNFNENTYSIGLNAGEHEIAIDSDFFTLAFEEVEETRSGDEIYRITDFQVNNKDALAQLYPGYFDMDALDLSGLPRLNYLSSRSGNRIASVNVSDCPELNRVTLYSCGVENFTFAGTPITDLRLSDNMLTEIDLSGLPDLSSLEIENNRLKKLDITGLASLRTLRASGNGMTDFVYGGNDALEYLYIYDNALPALDLAAFPAMKYCSAYGQTLTMSIDTENFDTVLLGDGFDLSRASRWSVTWFDEDRGYWLGADCTVEGGVVIIPETAGRELSLNYDYLISPEEEKVIYVKIQLTREGFNSVADLVADGTVSVNGDRVTFADGIRGEVYTAGGVCVFKGEGETGGLAKGIYIVRVGSSVIKVSIP